MKTIIAAAHAGALLGASPEVIEAEAGSKELDICALRPLAERMEAKGISTAPDYAAIDALAEEQGRIAAAGFDVIHMTGPSMITAHEATPTENDSTAEILPTLQEAAEINDESDLPIDEAADLLECSASEVTELAWEAGLNAEYLQFRDLKALAKRLDARAELIARNQRRFGI
jgi:hypothetical protein